MKTTVHEGTAEAQHPQDLLSLPRGVDDAAANAGRSPKSRLTRVTRLIAWSAGVLLAPLLLAVLFITFFGWNWLRGPIERDLGREKLDLTLDQRTKDTSPVALRSPIRVRGTLARPVVGVDKGRTAARAIGAIALGIIAPPLALIPLIDAGPGKDSDCGPLVWDARALPRAAHDKPRPGA